MPTYQYQCESCGHTFEKYQSIKAETLSLCPACGEHDLKKVISGGSGYFVKDSGVLPSAKPKSKSKEEEPQKKKPNHEHDHGHGHHHCHHHH